MRYLFCIAIWLLGLSANCASWAQDAISPLSEFSKEWNNPKYKVCNTGSKASYLSDKEKEIIHILNLARQNPQLFCNTVVKNVLKIVPETDTGSKVYYKSLVDEMQHMKPLPLLAPDSLCALSAKAHAQGLGSTGKTGHARVTPQSKKVTRFAGECCYYGSSDAVAIILTLLIDEGVESLGHRKICFYTYAYCGTGIAPHTVYGYAAVLDFNY